MSKTREALDTLYESSLAFVRFVHYLNAELTEGILKIKKESLQELVDRDEAKQVNHLHPLKSFGKCPSCNKSVHILHHRQFCGDCGTRLIWGGKKE